MVIYVLKPRIFVSSTYYDLKHIRNNLKNFIDSLGYESVLFERGDIPYLIGLPLSDSCALEVANCDILVLIIGGYFGSPLSPNNSKIDETQDDVESATIKEYKSAKDHDIQTYIFVERNVHTEFKTFQKNKDINKKFRCYYVNDKRIYNFIEKLYSINIHPIYEFDKFEDISSTLRDQWAGLFAGYLKSQKDRNLLENVSSKINEFSQVTEYLKTYTEAIVEKVTSDKNYTAMNDNIQKKIEADYKKKLFKESWIWDSIFDLSKLYEVPLNVEDTYSALIKNNSIVDFMEEIGFEKKDSILISKSKIFIEKYDDLKTLLMNKI